ncbi:50S ribosomal protein L6 [Nitrosomonas ureae]|uniref:Large ribosomal subunit protein uL6 n=1 Tax=Nitrosomonas ureae TaxID=44577 RepID=A0A0S3AJG6_9PROT|nr:50S ribosomal protein L6 [Nitrosomonas ureae]ALQ51276.1 50S ribosomal protein L6 [Nitrosomonas ureae]PXX15479.1 large subunit ribosomal protein L6 [Nitrosomonas ureae]SDU24966.1 large subunit ribosomal protein L6 [Nitrosomonas ureae]SEQ14389.1 large subunit ribosomal protein L6 [Nitrosomonas ureae]
MSRVSKNPVVIPSSVEVSSSDIGLTVKGPLGVLHQKLTNSVMLEVTGNEIRVKCVLESKQANAMSGTMRSLIANMVQGVTVGFEKKLQLVGVGYRAQATQDRINLALGFSHSIDYIIPEGIKIETPTQTEIHIKGTNKQMVGQVAADLRSYRKPEPYKGKGIRYSNESIILKETKKK